MARTVTTADLLESICNVVYGKAQDSLAAAIKRRELLDGSAGKDAGQFAFQFATMAQTCLIDAGRLDVVEIGQPNATLFCMERLARILDIGMPPAKRVVRAFRLMAEAKKFEDDVTRSGGLIADAKQVFSGALLDYLDGKHAESDRLPA